MGGASLLGLSISISISIGISIIISISISIISISISIRVLGIQGSRWGGHWELNLGLLDARPQVLPLGCGRCKKVAFAMVNSRILKNP